MRDMSAFKLAELVRTNLNYAWILPTYGVLIYFPIFSCGFRCQLTLPPMRLSPGVTLLPVEIPLQCQHSSQRFVRSSVPIAPLLRWRTRDVEPVGEGFLPFLGTWKWRGLQKQMLFVSFCNCSLQEGGAVVTWGDPACGGDSSNVHFALREGAPQLQMSLDSFPKQFITSRAFGPHMARPRLYRFVEPMDPLQQWKKMEPLSLGGIQALVATPLLCSRYSHPMMMVERWVPMVSDVLISMSWCSVRIDMTNFNVQKETKKIAAYGGMEDWRRLQTGCVAFWDTLRKAKGKQQERAPYMMPYASICSWSGLRVNEGKESSLRLSLPLAMCWYQPTTALLPWAAINPGSTCISCKPC